MTAKYTDSEVCDLFRKGQNDRVLFVEMPGEGLRRRVVALANKEGGVIIVGIRDEQKSLSPSMRLLEKFNLVTTSLDDVVRALEPKNQWFNKSSLTFQTYEVEIQDSIVVVVEVGKAIDVARLANGQAYILEGIDVAPWQINDESTTMWWATPQYIQKLINEGESETAAFCDQLDDRIAETLVALANKRGGYLLIGIDKSGKPTDLSAENSKSFLQSLDNRLDPCPKTDCRNVRVSEKDILVIKVERSTNWPAKLADGTAYERNGASNKKIIQPASSFTLNSEAASTLETRIGTGCRPCRDASPDEKCLGVDPQAEALATFIRSAVGEFCFAVFGRWGRGKTFLMKEVAARLTNDGYHAVWFNAWKYRTTPELWAYLYESIVGSLTTRSVFRSVSLAGRAYAVRSGWWGMSLYAGLSLFMILPFAALLHIVVWAIGLIGVAVFVYLIVLARRVYHAGTLVSCRFAKLASYQATLGLQAAIGDDLRSAIIGAVPSGYFGKRTLWGVRLATIGVGVVLAVILWYLDHSNTSILSAAPLLPDIHTWQLSVSCGVWYLALAIGLHVGLKGLPQRDHLLLIVDDLDRCAPQQMLEIIESLKLLLEDPAIHARVQVVMLVEESLLCRAIADKFGRSDSVREQHPRGPRLPLHTLVDEHIDKLFLAYYRFPSLVSDEIGDATDVFIRAQLNEAKNDLLTSMKKAKGYELDWARAQLQEYETLLPYEPEGGCSAPMSPMNTSESPDAAGQEPTSVGSDDVRRRSDGTSDSSVVSVKSRVKKIDGLVYSRAEWSELRGTVMHLAQHEDPKSAHDWGPRGVRLFLYRYQLIRLLLQVSGYAEVGPAEIIGAIKRAYENRWSDKPKVWSGIDPRLKRVVRSVV